MSKDTIYIDVEDDITAIIGKVKGAKSKIVALVPPKRVGVLQSAVNLRLLARAAKQTNKHLVLISGNSALTALAASAGIPSARNLQSKPELVKVGGDEDDTGEDVIDGADLPVGELARVDGGMEDEVQSQAAPAIDSAIRASTIEEAAAVPAAPRPQPKGRVSSIAVPNFDTFRKRLLLIVGGIILLAGFSVWAIWFAPRAEIIITARTIESSANPNVILATSAKTDVGAGTLKAVRQEIQQDASLEFEATGEKEVGEKAEGQVIFRNCRSTNPVAIAAGTGISAGGLTYITQSAVSVPGMTVSGGCNPGVSQPVTVVAQEIGEDYNTDDGTQFSVSGQPSIAPFTFLAVASTDIDGGSKKKVKVVAAEDVEKATNELANQNVDTIKKDLITKFGSGVIVIDASFASNKDGVVPSPAIDAEAPEGKAKLTGTILYTMIGVAESEAGRFLDDYFAQQMKDKTDQRVYSNGAEKTTFIDVKSVDNGYTATMTATATLGPKIDDATVRSQARGKKYGEVQSAIEGISGVESVSVEFSPFWVRTVPNDENRITVEFNLDESK